MKYYSIIFYPLLNLIIYTSAFDLCSENVQVITDFGPQDCDADLEEYYTLDQDCFPSCVKRQGHCKFCNEKLLCSPGLKCALSKCSAVDEKSCAKYRYLSGTLWKPDCMPDGTFAPKQCKGEKQNGRCYCFDQVGNRIFGQEWSHLAENMTCACSRRRAELERSGRQDVTLHCDSRGDFEPLQCDGGLCWCADPATGTVLHAVLPETMMTLLPCYVAARVGSQYLRKCESVLIAREKIRQEFEVHGTKQISYPLLKCDWDGSFGPFRIQHGSAYCTWRDDTLLGSYQSTVNQNTKYLTCICARDKKIYELDGVDHLKECEADGSYKDKQIIEDKYYCVDSEGFPTTELSDTPIEKCPQPTLSDCPPKH